MSRNAPHTPSSDRAADEGHFNQYGMRDDPRGVLTSHPENPGTGAGARRFGQGGDASTYENRDVDAKRTEEPQGPIARISSGGSARDLDLDYGGERHKDVPLSSRQGAELIGEKRHLGPDGAPDAPSE